MSYVSNDGQLKVAGQRYANALVLNHSQGASSISGNHVAMDLVEASVMILCVLQKTDKVAHSLSRLRSGLYLQRSQIVG